jgi:hypothetical protein
MRSVPDISSGASVKARRPLVPASRNARPLFANRARPSGCGLCRVALQSSCAAGNGSVYPAVAGSFTFRNALWLPRIHRLGRAASSRCRGSPSSLQVHGKTPMHRVRRIPAHGSTLATSSHADASLSSCRKTDSETHLQDGVPAAITLPPRHGRQSGELYSPQMGAAE